MLLSEWFDGLVGNFLSFSAHTDPQPSVLGLCAMPPRLQEWWKGQGPIRREGGGKGPEAEKEELLETPGRVHVNLRKLAGAGIEVCSSVSVLFNPGQIFYSLCLGLGGLWWPPRPFLVLRVSLWLDLNSRPVLTPGMAGVLSKILGPILSSFGVGRGEHWVLSPKPGPGGVCWAKLCSDCCPLFLQAE